MATTTVEGKVERVFYEGKGAEVVETFTVQGKEQSKRWSAFFDQPHGLPVGSTVKVSGLHGDKVDEWEKDGEKRHTVKRTLNKARTEGRTAAPTAPGNYNDETPF